MNFIYLSVLLFLPNTNNSVSFLVFIRGSVSGFHHSFVIMNDFLFSYHLSHLLSVKKNVHENYDENSKVKEVHTEKEEEIKQAKMKWGYRKENNHKFIH